MAFLMSMVSSLQFVRLVCDTYQLLCQPILMITHSELAPGTQEGTVFTPGTGGGSLWCRLHSTKPKYYQPVQWELTQPAQGSPNFHSSQVLSPTHCHFYYPNGAVQTEGIDLLCNPNSQPTDAWEVDTQESLLLATIKH